MQRINMEKFYTIKEFDKIPKNEKKFDVITILGYLSFLQMKRFYLQ